SLLSRLMSLVFSKRQEQIEYFRKHPRQPQKKQFSRLIDRGRLTAFGRDHGFDQIRNYSCFQRQVPVQDYDSLKPYINRAREGEDSVLWPGKVKWFAKSSGTTNDISKFIPVTPDGLTDTHMRGPKDVMTLVLHLFPDTKAYDGKLLTLGGSHKLDPLGTQAQSGDLSSILIENTPLWARTKRVPRPETALIEDFEEKVRKICEETIDKRVTAFAGVPSWNLVMMNKILEITGKNKLLELWTDLSYFIPGGMNFEPYREQYEKLIPSTDMRYMETYNASEGFFAIQDDPRSKDLLLMLDYGMFYEFLPTDQLDNPAKAVPLSQVKKGVNYALIISNSNGLWRYMIGDTVEFTSIKPHKIRITGRTKLYLNAFGEEIIIDNADRAIRAASQATGATVQDYTAAPVFMQGRSKGAHEWLIEFSREPDSLSGFAQALDQMLQQLNSDYQAKRYKDTTLYAPVVRALSPGTFYVWMESRGKVGGQHKVPRLSNERKYVEELLRTAGLENNSAEEFQA
ncbi:MAG: GH3 auxin-responsive promoter family protein, partial [Rikenellaceae bacterium]|nr:GH3 auxin-responsive promoter family protein [Rikenellaceae bacterium]